MAGPTPAVAAVRLAVRRWLIAHNPTEVTVAVSGGADSLALCSAALFETRGGVAVHGVTIDHQLQPGSAEHASSVRRWMVDSGCVTAQAIQVNVGRRGGIEAAAREARYRALDEARRGDVLLGHTLDDQAETVLLGLARGSGARSLHGMAAYDAPWGRPLLAIRAADTRAYCRDLGIDVWDDPHNTDSRFTRVRLRTEVLPLLEDVLGGGVAPALARTADQLRATERDDDTAALLALLSIDTPEGPALDAIRLASFSRGTRSAVLKRWLDDRTNARDADAVTSAHVTAVDALVTDYHGQGPAYLPGGSRVVRARGKILQAPADESGRAAPQTHHS